MHRTAPTTRRSGPTLYSVQLDKLQGRVLERKNRTISRKTHLLCSYHYSMKQEAALNYEMGTWAEGASLVSLFPGRSGSGRPGVRGQQSPRVGAPQVTQRRAEGGRPVSPSSGQSAGGQASPWGRAESVGDDGDRRSVSEKKAAVGPSRGRQGHHGAERPSGLRGAPLLRLLSRAARPEAPGLGGTCSQVSSCKTVSLAGAVLAPGDTAGTNRRRTSRGQALPGSPGPREKGS